MNLCQKAQGRGTKETQLNHWTLKSGAKCVLAPIPEAPLTCIDLWCRAGSAFETSGDEGLAHFLEHMVFKGSSTLDAGEFDLQIETLGGSSNAATGFDDVHFFVLVPPKAAFAALDLLLNLVLSPAFDPEAYCLEREVVLEEIAQSKDQPDEQVFQELLRNCWRNHPYGRPILGEEKSLKKSTPETMRAFHNRQYIGKNCCIVIAGNIPKGIDASLDKSQLAELSNKDLDINSTSSNSQVLTFKKDKEELFIPRLESARLLMAWEFPPASNQQMIMGADIATSILAEGRRSRLVQKLREDLRLVESIEMDLTVLEQGSLVILEACCLENNLEKVEGEIQKLLKESCTLTSNAKELRRATQLVRNGLYFNLEASAQVAALIGSHSLWGRDQTLLQPLEHIEYWSHEKLNQGIFSLLQPENSYTLIARPNK